jgi:hypothetical protein
VIVHDIVGEEADLYAWLERGLMGVNENYTKKAIG